MSALKMTQKRAFEFYFLLKLHEDYKVRCNFVVHFKRSSNKISAKEQVTKLDKMAKVHLHLPKPCVFVGALSCRNELSITIAEMVWNHVF